MSLTPGFSASRRTLLTRGVLHVTAHVRGGMENGYRWYASGRMADKDNSFNDLIGAAESLIRDGLTRAGRIVLHGGSAGGLLVGTAVMRRPELFAGVIADVPFVDVLDTMLDADLPLTPPEWPEWGNPGESDDARRRIGKYAPTEIVAPVTYPCILATAGLTDPRVTYWEPARWIATLNAQATGGPFLLWTELHAGHGGPSGRYAGLDDLARIYQAVMRLFDLPKDAPYDL
jgi:oligopeptidase B